MLQSYIILVIILLISVRYNDTIYNILIVSNLIDLLICKIKIKLI